MDALIRSDFALFKGYYLICHKSQSCITCQLFAYFIYLGILTCFVKNVQNRAKKGPSGPLDPSHLSLKVEQSGQKLSSSPWACSRTTTSVQTRLPVIINFNQGVLYIILFVSKDLHVGTLNISIGVMWRSFGKCNAVQSKLTGI